MILTFVGVAERLTKEVQDSALAVLREVVASTDDDSCESVRHRVSHLCLLRRDGVGELGDEGVDSRLVDHENSESCPCSVSNRQTRDVGQALDECALQLRELHHYHQYHVTHQ